MEGQVSTCHMEGQVATLDPRGKLDCGNVLEAATQVLRFSLALWVCGTLVVVLAAPLLFREIASRDLAGRIFGELLRRFEAVKQLLSLLMVLAVFVELETTRALGGRSFVMGVAVFVAVATNVYLAMVVRPRLGYMREKVGSGDRITFGHFEVVVTDAAWLFDFLRR